MAGVEIAEAIGGDCSLSAGSFARTIDLKEVGRNATALLRSWTCRLRTFLTVLGALRHRPIWIGTPSAVHESSAAEAETSR